MERQQQQQVNSKVTICLLSLFKIHSQTQVHFLTLLLLFFISNTSRDRSNSWQYLSFDRGALAENQSDDRFAVTTSPKITHRTHWESARRNAERFGERTVSIFKRKRACIAYMESTVVDISIPPFSFNIQKYIYWVKKRLVWVVLDIEGDT